MSRSELKENLLAAQVEKALEWGIERKTPILMTTAAVVGLILIGSVVVLRREQARDTAETQIAIAQSLIMQQRSDQAIAMLKNARTGITDRNLLARLTYVQGTASLAAKNVEDSVACFRESVDLSGGTPLQPLALSNLGFAQESKKDYEGAAAAYSRFMTDYGNHFLAPRVQLSLGRTLFAAGKSDDGRKSLSQLIDLYPTSVWAQSARQILAQHK